MVDATCLVSPAHQAKSSIVQVVGPMAKGRQGYPRYRPEYEVALSSLEGRQWMRRFGTYVCRGPSISQFIHNRELCGKQTYKCLLVPTRIVLSGLKRYAS